METLQVVLTEQQIQEKVAEMATAISAAYTDRTLCVVGLLDNAFIFTADLVRRLSCPATCHFTKFEIRDVMEGTYERRQIDYALPVDVGGQHVLLVECILQTGVTLDHLIQRLIAHGAKSVRTVLLIDKVADRRVPVETDFVGFRIEDTRYLVGYGMGYRNLYRNLPYVASITQTAQGART
jgi:hypoxanthine phosphoribosyltransferase